MGALHVTITHQSNVENKLITSYYY